MENKYNGIPNFISFDHDLGCDEDGNILKIFSKTKIEADIAFE